MPEAAPGPAAALAGSTAVAVLDALPDATLILDADRAVVAANVAVRELTGWSAEQLHGRPCAEVLGVRHGPAQAPWPDRWPEGAEVPSVQTMAAQPLLLRAAGGGDVAAVATIRYLRDPDGSVVGAVMTLRPGPPPGTDSEPSAIEVVSTVSHELRSPLTSVKGYTSLLLNRWERLGDEQKKMMLGQVNHDADRVVRLITELLDISRLETGRLVLRRQLVDLAALARNVVDKVRLEYPELDATLQFDPGAPKVWADPDKVEQVLTNLVENACKYGSPRGLRLVGEAGPEAVNVVVTDQGEGIPSQDLPKVFTKFFRRAEGKPTGSGLGLWISRGLVEAHGGELRADSPPGQGASFRFTLPVVDVEKLQEP